jgi:hypothetical protein
MGKKLTLGGKKLTLGGKKLTEILARASKIRHSQRLKRY